MRFQLLHNPILFNQHRVRNQLCVPHMIAQMEEIRAFFQHIGGTGHHTLIIIAGKQIRFHAQRQILVFAGGKQPRLGKRAHYPLGLAQLALGRFTVQLNNLLSGNLARIGDPAGYADITALQHAAIHIGDGKGGIAQAEAEGITHTLRCAGNRLKVTVADEDVLVVRHIIVRFCKRLRGRIVFKCCCQGIRQVT